MANILSKIGSIFGSTAGSAISAANPLTPAATVLSGVKGIIGMFKLDPTAKAAIEAQLTEANLDLEKTQLVGQLQSIEGQLEINKQEAASTNWFVAGWRPAVGWVCVLGLFYGYILQPFLTFLLVAFHVKLEGPLPSIDSNTLISGLLIPLLGIAGYRTIEKITNTEGNR